MKASELRDKTVGDLQLKEKELSVRLFALRLQNATRRLEKPSKIREARRELARVLTVLREKR